MACKPAVSALPNCTPSGDITFVYGVADEAGAAGTVSQDAEASADVFKFANDTLTTLTDAGALAKFGGKYADEIKATNSEALVDSLTLDGYVYGVPFTTNHLVHVLRQERFQARRTSRAWTPCWKKASSASRSPTPWYLPAFYFGNGCTLFGDGTQEELGARFRRRKRGRRHRLPD